MWEILVMKKIKFIPINEETESVIESPRPASQVIPDWYKKTKPNIVNNGISIMPNSGKISVGSNLTIKRCVPFLDAMTTGYVVELAADVIFVDPNEYAGNRVIWGANQDVVALHTPEQLGEMKMPEGFGEVWKWLFPFQVKTPPGYSVMFMHPIHVYDLPFLTITGVVDTDKYDVPTNFPFFVKKNFMGKIPKGTPICQIFPFKRESWSSERKPVDSKMVYRLNNITSVLDRAYKVKYWSRKSYR